MAENMRNPNFRKHFTDVLPQLTAAVTPASSEQAVPVEETKEPLPLP
jgi:hypothetical protein